MNETKTFEPLVQRVAFEVHRVIQAARKRIENDYERGLRTKLPLQIEGSRYDFVFDEMPSDVWLASEPLHIEHLSAKGKRLYLESDYVDGFTPKRPRFDFRSRLHGRKHYVYNSHHVRNVLWLAYMDLRTCLISPQSPYDSYRRRRRKSSADPRVLAV
jgi:hypothetical protein